MAPVTHGAPKERHFQLRKSKTEHSKHLSLISSQFFFIIIIIFNKQDSIKEKSVTSYFFSISKDRAFLPFCKLFKQTDSGGREDVFSNSRNPVSGYSIFIGRLWSYLNHQEGFIKKLHIIPLLPHPYASTRQSTCWILSLK